MLRELTDSEALVAVLAGVAQDATGPHPDLDLLLDYRSETLPAETEQRVRDHLVGCQRCTQSLLDLASFHEMDSQVPSTVANLAVTASWRDFKTRIDETNRSAYFQQPPLRKLRPAFYALAASLLLGVVGQSFWVAQLRQTVHRLSSAQVNPPSIILSHDTRGNEAVLLEVPPGQQFFRVIAIPASTKDFPTYLAELSNATGQVIWRAESGLSEAESIEVVFYRHQLPAGDYRVRVDGLDGDRRTEVFDGLMRLRYL